MKKLLKLFEKKTEIASQIEARIRYLYPIGTVIKFEKGQGIVSAEVLDHYPGQSLFVRNLVTLKEYRVDIWSDNVPEIIEAPHEQKN